MNVGTNGPTVEIVNPSTGTTTTHNVEPGKDTTLPLPNDPGGTILVLKVGTGLKSQVVLIELIETGP
ncbi:MAG: hypothetical protein KDE27_14745 [Planctomycetes bacterium]|nr:hypothetical protein [Planctomycetota bacterium]